MNSESNTMNKKEDLNNVLVHMVLSHSYTTFLLAIFLGVIFDIYFPISIFNHKAFQYLGVVMILFGTCIVYLAQHASACFSKNKKEKSALDFTFGPYKYTRNPTHLGLTIMSLGFALVINSLFSLIFLIVAALISKFVFVRKQEQALEDKYGESYREYKKIVSTWV